MCAIIEKPAKPVATPVRQEVSPRVVVDTELATRIRTVLDPPVVVNREKTTASRRAEFQYD